LSHLDLDIHDINLNLIVYSFLYFLDKNRGDSSNWTYDCGICGNVEPEYLLLNTLCDHTVCPRCYLKMRIERRSRQKICFFCRNFFVNPRKVLLKLDICPKNNEDATLAADPIPVPQTVDEQLRQQEEEEEAENEEAAREIQRQLDQAPLTPVPYDEYEPPNSSSDDEDFENRGNIRL
jgi:hypothetical protein